MDCNKINDLIYEDRNSDDNADYLVTLYYQIRVWLHSLICQDCAEKIRNYEKIKTIMSEDFLPSSPDFENSLMAIVNVHDETQEKNSEEYREDAMLPGGLSTRGWIIAGLIIVISLVTAFLGFNFRIIANETGIYFLLPVGIIFGIVITTYCALFIGSHLKELTERFGL